MVTDLPARPLLMHVTNEGDHRQAGKDHPDNDGERRQCSACGFAFVVDEASSAESAWWLCAPCAMASLGGGSLQQRTFDAGGSLAQRTVFRR